MLHNLDSDSSKIIEAVRSTGVVITEAMRLYVDYIVSNMKSIGTWDLCNAVYGFVGGTAASHKFNWKDLRDVDAAFRLSFFNSPAHDSFGITGNGSNAYANTFFIPRTNLGNSSLSFSVYSTKNTNEATNKIMLGAINVSDLSLTSLALTFSVEIGVSNSFGNDYANVTKRADNKGYILVKTGVGNNQLIYNDISFNLTNKFNSSLSSNNDVFLLARNSLGSPQLPTSKSIGFAHLGSGLTNTQAQQQSQIVINAQLILNRA